MLTMPKRRDEILPFCGDAVGTNFTRTCQFLRIIDLHLHDLRYDGISRLFKVGRNIPQVAAVSGHRSWSSLKRYTHLRQTGDKYAGWKRLAILTRSTSPQIRDTDTHLMGLKFDDCIQLGSRKIAQSIEAQF
jgi:hypothetical protein